jgi:membrane protein implicated in regulation of membrane protease activity
MAWSVWILISIALLIGEAAIPGTLFLAFFSLAAFLTAAVTALFPALSVSFQLVIFSVASLLMLIALRPAVVNRMSRKRSDQPPTQQRAICITDIKAGNRGRVELQGTTWQALNIGEADLNQGADSIVESIEGLLVKVRAP